MPLAHFEEAVDEEDEFREIGGKSSAKDIFLTLATDFLTEAPALEHLFLNSARPNLGSPGIEFFIVNLGALPLEVSPSRWSGT